MLDLKRLRLRAAIFLFALFSVGAHVRAEPTPSATSLYVHQTVAAVPSVREISAEPKLSTQPSAMVRYGQPSVTGSRSWKTESGERLIVLPAWLFSDWLHAFVMGSILSLTVALRFYFLRRRRLQHEMRIAVRMGERNRIARELHDSLLQSFHGLMFRLQTIRNVLPNSPVEAAELIDGTLTRGDHAMDEARRAIQQLRGLSGEERDLVRSVEALAQDIQARDDAQPSPVFRVVESGEPRRFDQLIHDDIYCIVREAVRNAFRHAQARHIDVEIQYAAPNFFIHVRDDGVGMSADVVGQKRRVGHWGIQGMKERAVSFGGDVQIDSTQHTGTTVCLMVPSKLFTHLQSASRPWLARFRPDFRSHFARNIP